MKKLRQARMDEQDFDLHALKRLREND